MDKPHQTCLINCVWLMTHIVITQSVMNENLAIPFSKGALFHRSFSYSGPKL